MATSSFPGSGGWPSEAILPPSSIRLAARRNGWKESAAPAREEEERHGKPEASGGDFGRKQPSPPRREDGGVEAVGWKGPGV